MLFCYRHRCKIVSCLGIGIMIKECFEYFNQEISRKIDMRGFCPINLKSG